MSANAKVHSEKKLSASRSMFGWTALLLGVCIFLVWLFRSGSIDRMQLEYSARQKLEAIYGSPSSGFRHFTVVDPIEKLKVQDRLLPWEVYVYFESDAKPSMQNGQSWETMPPDQLATEYSTFISSRWSGITNEILKQNPEPSKDRYRMYLINDGTGTRHVLIYHRADLFTEFVELLNKLNQVPHEK